ncbi:MAG: hypothetical protein OEZ10_08530 [Gammaproteobacteria bacterium]|nr:hypothetical protein [Gammaproteobacteria bacterium]
MADIRKAEQSSGRDRKEAMTALRINMRQQNDCLEESAHCDNARKAIITSMKPVVELDPPYFRNFFKQHQEFASSFNDYKFVEELCVVVCAIEAWDNSFAPQASGDDPYSAIPWIGGLNLHLHASMYFGFSKQDMLRCFKIVQEMKEYELDCLTDTDFEFPDLQLKDSEDWMLYFVAAICMKFREAISVIDMRRTEFGISGELRSDIISSIKSTYWWRYMMMSRAIEPAAEGLPGSQDSPELELEPV